MSRNQNLFVFSRCLVTSTEFLSLFTVRFKCFHVNKLNGKKKIDCLFFLCLVELQ
jgi:hypothetical protein